METGSQELVKHLQPSTKSCQQLLKISELKREQWFIDCIVYTPANALLYHRTQSAILSLPFAQGQSKLSND